MIDAMGCFRVGCRIENHRDRSRSVQVPDILVDARSQLSWIATETLDAIGVEKEAKKARFRLADGRILTRSVGFAILRVDRSFSTDEVVFARKGDRELLGARTLTGLGLSVDSRNHRLAPGGPLLAIGNVRIGGIPTPAPDTRQLSTRRGPPGAGSGARGVRGRDQP